MRRKYNTLAELRAVRARTQRDYNQRKREERKLVRNTMLARIESLEKTVAQLESIIAS
jgi:hypothetical protein